MRLIQGYFLFTVQAPTTGGWVYVVISYDSGALQPIPLERENLGFAVWMASAPRVWRRTTVPGRRDIDALYHVASVCLKYAEDHHNELAGVIEAKIAQLGLDALYALPQVETPTPTDRDVNRSRD